jgi:hypothetical protein
MRTKIIMEYPTDILWVEWYCPDCASKNILKILRDIWLSGLDTCMGTCHKCNKKTILTEPSATWSFMYQPILPF